MICKYKCFLILVLIIIICSCEQWTGQKDRPDTAIAADQLLDGATHNSGITAIIATPDNRFLTSAADSTIIVWYIPAQQAYRKISTGQAVTALQLNKSADTLWAGLANGQIRLFLFPSLQTAGTLTAHQQPVRAIYRARKGQRVISLDAGGTLVTWNGITRHTEKTVTLPAAFGKDLQIMAQVDGSSIRIRDLATDRNITAIRTDATTGRSGPVSTLSFAGNDSLLVTARGRDVLVWNLRRSELLGRLLGHLAEVEQLSVSPNGRFLASGGLDKSVHIWRVRSEEREHVLYGHFHSITGLCFSAGGDTLFSASDDNSIVMWRVTDGKFLARLGRAVTNPKQYWQISRLQAWPAATFTIGDETYRPLKEGFEVLKIRLRIQNVSASELVFYSSNLRLIDAKNRVVRMTARDGHVALKNDEYFKHRLQPGEAFQGVFVYLIEQGQKKFDLYYEELGPQQIRL